MLAVVFFFFLGYLSGSVLYANVFGAIFGKKALYAQSKDQNPGTANAYRYGGFWCGTLTLLFDLLKGFLPVFLYLHFAPGQKGWGLSLILAAPVAGHIFSVFEGFRGGKGIATTFGSLLGLFPYRLPFFLLAAAFIFLSVGLRITPHYYRTLAAYFFAAFAMVFAGVAAQVWMSFWAITAMVCLRLHLGGEEKERPEVKLLWMR